MVLWWYYISPDWVHLHIYLKCKHSLVKKSNITNTMQTFICYCSNLDKLILNTDITEQFLLKTDNSAQHTWRSLNYSTQNWARTHLCHFKLLDTFPSTVWSQLGNRIPIRLNVWSFFRTMQRAETKKDKA